jgi:hypothetical protein
MAKTTTFVMRTREREVERKEERRTARNVLCLESFTSIITVKLINLFLCSSKIQLSDITFEI